MSLGKKIILSAVACLAAAGTASADNYNSDYEGWYTGLAGGYMFTEGDMDTKTAQSYEARVGYDFDTKWSLEGGVGINPHIKNRTVNQSGFVPDSSHQVGVVFRLDGLYHLMEAGAQGFDPFLSLGGDVVVREDSNSDGSADWSWGGGFGTFYNLENNWYIKGEYHLTSINQSPFVGNEVLASVGYRFGEEKKNKGTSGPTPRSAAGDAGKRLDPVYFAFDSSELSPAARATLKKNVDYVKTNKTNSVTIEGNCDERGTQEYNYALGQRRANSAEGYMVTSGVEKQKINTVSYGEDRPADPAHNEAAWAKNRRDEFVVR